MTRRLLALLASAVVSAGCATIPRVADSPRAGKTISDSDIIAFPGGDLHIHLSSDGSSVAEWITNDYAIPVAVDMQRETVNLRDVDTRATILLAPHVPQRIALWNIADHSAAWHEDSHFKTQYGDPAAKAAPYVYALPFAAGATFPLIQGFNSGFSHSEDNAYAVDFEMPEGTPIRAAREGTIIAFNATATEHALTDDFKDTGHANWIAVLHDDHTLGEYWHLQPDGVKVKVGQRVARGDVIGLSGWTGFSSVPHLHFAVQTAVNGHHAVSFPFVFKTSPADQRGATPVEGQSYTAFE